MEKFDTIFQNHYADIYSFLLKISNYNNDISEELTQETFYQAYLSIANFKGNCQLKTWLIQIAKNRFYMGLRKEKYHPAFFREMIKEPVEHPIEEIADEIYKKEILFHARLIIDNMQPNMKDVMLYRIYSDLPYSEIAALLSISKSSAKVLFFRGKELLRKELKETYKYEI